MVVKAHPKKTFAAACVPLFPIAHFGLKALSRHRLEAPILKKIEQGSRPLGIPSEPIIDRPLLEEELRALVSLGTYSEVSDDGIGEPGLGLFGVVIGPSGTGKTALIRKICSSDPKGVLYVEVFDPNYLGKDLGTEVGMVQQPTSPIDLLFTYLSGDSYAQYHKIPKDPSGSMHYVLARLEEQAKKYKSKHGRTPVLVIDGIDLLAKRNKMLFIDLVDRAKHLANSRTLKIIFVSSEGSVIPLVKATSSKSRLADTVEVLDVSDEDAVKFFSNALVPNELAQKIVPLCGGRFVHLISAVAKYILLRKAGVEDINVLYKSIMDHLVLSNVETSVQTLFVHPEKERQLCKRILQEVLSNGELKTPAIVKILGTSTEQVEHSLSLLVSCNLLRFTSGGMVAFHSRLVKWAFERDMIDFGLLG